jgi:uncharacterized protein YgiM (DUF1202 family)
MRKVKIVPLVFFIMLYGLSACNLPGTPDTSPATATYTDTPLFTPTSSNTPLPTYTFTPSTPMVSVSLETNCRTGPGTGYDAIGNGLQVGQTAEVLGRDSSGQFWIIRDPDNPAIICWLWGQYATVTGDWQSLPVMTPPPTPTPIPAFTVAFYALDQCMVMRYTRLQITNTGELTWESMTVTVLDLDTAISSAPRTDDTFTDATSCGETTVLQDLTPGESGIIYTQGFNYNLPGHNLQATVTLCTQNGLAGTCLT